MRRILLFCIYLPLICASRSFAEPQHGGALDGKTVVIVHEYLKCMGPERATALFFNGTATSAQLMESLQKMFGSEELVWMTPDSRTAAPYAFTIRDSKGSRTLAVVPAKGELRTVWDGEIENLSVIDIASNEVGSWRADEIEKANGKEQGEPLCAPAKPSTAKRGGPLDRKTVIYLNEWIEGRNDPRFTALIFEGEATFAQLNQRLDKIFGSQEIVSIGPGTKVAIPFYFSIFDSKGGGAMSTIFGNGKDPDKI